MPIYTPFSAYPFARVVVRILLLAVMLCPLYSHAQTVPDTKGRDFWLTFPPNYHDDFDQDDSLYIFIAATEPTAGVIAYRTRNNAALSRAFTIADPSQVYTFGIAWQDVELRGVNTWAEFNPDHQSGRVAPQSFHVTSDKDITVYALNRARTTSDAMLVLPTDVLGTSYRVMSYNSDGRDKGFATVTVDWQLSTPSQLAIVATQNNTSVTITPSAPVFGIATTTTTITLNEGNVYLLQAFIDLDNLRGDLTGTAIESSAPIAVFSGHQRSLLPVNQTQLSSRDFLIEQMPPISTWGKSYIITPFPLPTSAPKVFDDIFRVLAAYDNTTVSTDGMGTIRLRAGEFFEAPLTTATLLTSSKEVLVAQYKRSASRSNGNTISDPFMIIVPPRKQFLSSYLCITAQTYMGAASIPVYPEQYSTIICPTDFINTIKIDNTPVDTKLFEPVPNTCYSYAWIPMRDGSHTIEAEKPIGLYMYGYGFADSYGYVGGMAFTTFEEEPIGVTPDTLICKGDSVQLLATGGKSYEWSPSEGLSCTDCPDPIAKPLGRTRYSVAIKDTFGCVYMRSVVVDAPPIPIPVVSTDTTICAGKPVQLHAAGGAFYTWLPPTELSCTDCPNPIATPKTTTTYKVLVSNGGACMAEDSITVHVIPTSFGAVPNDTLLCAQDSIVFDLPTDVTYNWFPATGLSCTDCPNPVVRPQKTTTYNVTMINKAGCIEQKKLTVTVVSLPIVSVTPDTVLCTANLPIRLLAKGGNFYHWSPSEGLSCTDCASPLANPTTTTTYTVDISINESCKATTTVTVAVTPTPALALTPDTTLCANTPLQLLASGASSYHWSPSDGLSCTDCPNPLATTNASITYTVVATNDAGCSATDSVHIDILQLADVGMPPDLSLCAGSSVTLLATGGSSYHWSPSEGLSCTDCPNPTAQPAATTTYTVNITGNADCAEQRTVTVTVLPAPQLVVSADTMICRSGIAQLQATGGTTYSWTPHTGLSCTDCPNPTAQPATSTRYYVTASNDEGCSRTDSVLVTVRPCGLQAELSQATFSPLAVCNTAETVCTLINTGKEPFEIRSWKFEGSDADAFTAFLLEVTEPYTLAVQDSVHFLIQFHPLRKGTLTANLVVITHDEDFTISNECTGTAYLNKALFSLGSDVLTRPGATLSLDLYAQSDTWTDVAIDSLRIAIGYKTSWLQYANAIEPSVALPSNWSIRATELSGTTPGEKTLLITAGGPQPLQLSGTIATLSMMPLLSNELAYTPTLEVQAIGREQCVATEGKAATVDLSFCAALLRPVRYSGANYQFAVVGGTHAELPIQYSIGLAAPVRIELYNQLGKLVATREQAMLQPGTYSDVINTGELAAGMYIARFSSGPFSQSIPVLLGIE